MSEYTAEQRAADEANEAWCRRNSIGKESPNAALLRLLDAARAELATVTRERDEARRMQLEHSERAMWRRDVVRLLALLDECDDALVKLTTCYRCDGDFAIEQREHHEDCRPTADEEDGGDPPLPPDTHGLVIRIRAALSAPHPADAARVAVVVESVQRDFAGDLELLRDAPADAADLDAESFDAIVDAVKSPRPPSQKLRDLMRRIHDGPHGVTVLSNLSDVDGGR